MRLSAWRATAPAAAAMDELVLAALRPVLADLGADADPVCWVAWGSDPHLRYSVLAPTGVGLIVVAVRPVGPDGSPRATAKLVRWPKLAIGELAVESSGGHRIVAVQVDTIVLRGSDDEADSICEFVRGLIAETDDRGSGRVAIRYEVPVSEPGAETDATAPTPLPLETEPMAMSGQAELTAPRLWPGLEPAMPEPEPEPVEQAPPAALPAGEPDALPAGEPAAPLVQPDRTGWIQPHPVEEAPRRKPHRPRSWRP